MKRKIITTLTCLALLTGTVTGKSLVLTLADNTLIYYLLGGETNPMLRFVDGKITINADEYELTDIKNFYISAEDDPNSIENKLIEKQINYKANTLVVNAADAGSVRVFTSSGTKVQADIRQTDSLVSVDLNSLNNGVYIIRCGQSSFKVIKK